MLSVVQQRHLTAGLLVVIFSARMVGSNLPSPSPSQDVPEQQSSIETEVARWSAQLRSADQEARRDAAMNLARIEGAAATSALLSALRDASPLVRAVVVAGLGERADASVASAIAAQLASDKDVFVRKTAAYALGRCAGTQRTSALIAALKDKDPEVRGAVAVSLGDHPDPAAIGPLAAALSDKSAFVRAQAARALGINGPGARQTASALIGLLASDRDWEVKRQAAIALGPIGDRSALPALELATHDSDPFLVQEALASIRMLQIKK